MDGGINLDTIQMLYKRGAQDFAVGSAIFDFSDPVGALKQMTKLDKHL